MAADEPPLHIYWHHLGREHEACGYAGDLRKNDAATVERYLARRETPSAAGGHRFIRHDERTYLELPAEDAKGGFLIVYRPDQGLQYSLGYKKQSPWWLIDIVEIEERRPGILCVRDLFLDIQVERDGSYKVLDLEDYEEALRIGILSESQSLAAIGSLRTAISLLNSGAFPEPWLQSLAERYCPGRAPG